MKRDRRQVQRTVSRIIFGLAVFIFSDGTVLAAETIKQFNVTLTPYSNGAVEVVEEITYDFGTAERHGIYRDIELSHPQSASAWYKDRGLHLDDIVVKMDGETVPVSLEHSWSQQRIKIGDPDRTISGQHTYAISYDLYGAYSYYETEPAELYLNVTGSEWTVPIEKVTVTLLDREGIFGNARTCYAGRPGTGRADSETCAVASLAGQVVFTAGPLAPGEEVTIAQSFREGAVAYAPYETWQAWYVLAPLALLVVFGLLVSLWRFEMARRPRRRTIIAQYEPYPEVLPMFAGVLIDGTLSARDITAGLLYLAEQGFLTITRTEKKVLWLFNTDDYEVTLLQSKTVAPTKFHRSLLDLLFQTSDPGAVTKLSAFKADTSRQRKNQRILQQLKKSVRQDLVERGFFERKFPVRIFLMCLLAGVGVVVGGFLLVGESAMVLGVLLLVLTIAAAVSLYERRTKKGYEAMYHLKGFKEFLSVTGKDRFKFHNAPEKNPQQFLEYLPYAVAFNVEKEWSEVFKDITIAQPSWYSDTAGRSFSAAHLASDLGSFSSAFASSSGSSGSSGAGSTGGGAGGGGGGSW